LVVVTGSFEKKGIHWNCDSATALVRQTTHVRCGGGRNLKLRLIPRDLRRAVPLLIRRQVPVRTVLMVLRLKRCGGRDDLRVSLIDRNRDGY
jgi:hypothetical protein